MGKKQDVPAPDQGEVRGKVFEVAAWRESVGAAPTEVHVLVPVSFGEKAGTAVIRMKSKRAIDEVIGILLEYRRAVWPEPPS